MIVSEKKQCFVISPIGEPKSEPRKKSDLLFNHIIKPVMDEFQYITERADKIGEPGIITTQVIQRIENSPLVIADLTGPNANVFYELAIRHAIRKPLIQLISKGEPIPFDVAGLRTIPYDLTDLDSVEETKKELRKQVEAIEKGSFKMDTPISTAIDLMRLKESGDPEQQSLAKVTDLLITLRREMKFMSMEISRIRRVVGLEPRRMSELDEIRARTRELEEREIPFEIRKELERRRANKENAIRRSEENDDDSSEPA